MELLRSRIVELNNIIERGVKEFGMYIDLAIEPPVYPFRGEILNGLVLSPPKIAAVISQVWTRV